MRQEDRDNAYHEGVRLKASLSAIGLTTAADTLGRLLEAMADGHATGSYVSYRQWEEELERIRMERAGVGLVGDAS